MADEQELETARRFQNAVTDLAARPCQLPGPMVTCMDRPPHDPDRWCKPCWARHVVREMVLGGVPADGEDSQPSHGGSNPPAAT